MSTLKTRTNPSLNPEVRKANLKSTKGNFNPVPKGVMSEPVDISSLPQKNIPLNALNITPNKDSRYELLSKDIKKHNIGNLHKAKGSDVKEWLYGRMGVKELPGDHDAYIMENRKNKDSQLHSRMPSDIYYSRVDDPNNSNYFNAFSKNYSKLTARESFSHNSFGGGLDSPDYTLNTPEVLYGQDGWDTNVTHKIKPDLAEIQDHEASHAFNSTQKPVRTASGEIEYSQDPFYNKLKGKGFGNTTLEVKDSFNNTFRNTYMGSTPEEYVRAMSYAKRWGAGNGMDTMSRDPKIARQNMYNTIEKLHTHPELKQEGKRLLVWINQVYRNVAQDSYGDFLEANPDKANISLDNYMKQNEAALKQKAYNDILQYMTDSTIQGLVQEENNTDLNKMAAINSIHYNTKAINLLIKQANDKEKAKKDKPKKYSTSRFEKRVGVLPMTVVFDKRTDGTKRTMNFTRDWDMLNENPDKYKFKPSKGTGKTPDYSKKNLSLVWDLDKNGYRMVNLEKLYKITKFKGDL